MATDASEHIAAHDTVIALAETLFRAQVLLNRAWLNLLANGDVELADEIHAFLSEGESSGKRTDG